MKTIYDEYKEKICITCKHYKDEAFNKCEIRECITDTTENNCKTRAKCYYYERTGNERNNSIKQH